MNIFVPPELYELIKALAESQNTTEVEALKRAIAISSFFTRAVSVGSKVLVLRADGDIREVEFR